MFTSEKACALQSWKKYYLSEDFNNNNNNVSQQNLISIVSSMGQPDVTETSYAFLNASVFSIHRSVAL